MKGLCFFAFVCLIGVCLACDATSLIKTHEGSRKCMYKDSRGIKTIGVGLNLQTSSARALVERCGAPYEKIVNGPATGVYSSCNCGEVYCLSDSQIECLLAPSVSTAESGARHCVSNYDSLCCNVQNVMTDMAFNLGQGGLCSFNTFLSYIEHSNWSAAASDLRGTRWCGQVGNRCTDNMNRIRSGC